MKHLPYIMNPLHRLVITLVIGVLTHIKTDENFKAHWVSGR